MLPPPRPKIGGHLTILKEAASLWSGLRRRITCAICAMFSDFDADPLLIHPSLNHGMGIVAAAQILKEKSVALDPSQTCEKYFLFRRKTLKMSSFKKNIGNFRYDQKQTV